MSFCAVFNPFTVVKVSFWGLKKLISLKIGIVLSVIIDKHSFESFMCQQLYGQNELQLASPYRPRVVSPFLLQDIQHSLPTMSVQFSSRRYVCATNRLSENSPTLFLKQFQFLSDRDDGPFSPFQRRQSSSFSFYASLLQAIDGMLPQ